MAETLINPGSTGGNVDRSFSRQHSLRGRSNFLAVLAGKGTRHFHGRYCDLRHVDPGQNLKTKTPGTKFGIMISRRVGSAVRRNRLKRLIREFLRNNKRLWPVNKLVIIQLKAPVFDESGLIAEINDMIANIK